MTSRFSMTMNDTPATKNRSDHANHVRSSLIPVLKWAGGKRWFVSNHSDLLPVRYRTYIEPFSGSAAVFFYMNPLRAILSDTNHELMTTYNAIKLDWRRVYSNLKRHHFAHSPTYYYQLRNLRPRNIYSQAARFIYLNRTCWNGLYRVNLSGQFNVPIGTKTRVITSGDDFDSVSIALRHAELRCGDFESVIDEANEDDFLFIDPPYTVRHNHNGFIKYNEKLFSWEDQKRLRDAALRAKSRGARMIITNADHPSIVSLYKDDFSVKRVNRFSAISSKGHTRAKFEELIIT